MRRSLQHILDSRTRARLALRAGLALLVLCVAPALARADGDPASDVLVAQPTFVPWDAGVPPAAQLRLDALVREASTSGFPVRVALIASAHDLGSVTALWQEPETYARYLGEELSLLYHGTVLVVMPGGFGVYRPGGQVDSMRAVLAGLATPRRAQLAGAAELAVRRIARAGGHVLTDSTGAAGSPPRGARSGPTPWIVFVIGLWLVALAWWASIRARPPAGLRRRSRSSARG
ncbi:MAG: hypothetical protein ABSC56_00165 [Solirubrobacteraceae bacterium]